MAKPSLGAADIAQNLRLERRRIREAALVANPVQELDFNAMGAGRQKRGQ